MLRVSSRLGQATTPASTTTAQEQEFNKVLVRAFLIGLGFTAVQIIACRSACKK